MQNPINLLGPSDGFIVLNIFMFVAIIALPIYVVLRFLRAYERRTSVRDVNRSHEQQLEVMRDTVERLEQEVQRLSEAQQFTTSLLKENAIGAAREDSSPIIGQH